MQGLGELCPAWLCAPEPGGCFTKGGMSLTTTGLMLLVLLLCTGRLLLWAEVLGRDGRTNCCHTSIASDCIAPML